MKKRITASVKRNSVPRTGWRNRLVLLGAFLSMLGSLPANGGLGPQPPNSHSFGQTLAQWQATWLAWAFGDLTVATDTHGNAVINHVVLMGIPDTPGNGTPGSINITLNSGEAFVVPLILFDGKSFSNGTTSPMLSVDDFANMTLNLTLDGVSILDSDDALRYYTQTLFSPPLAFNSPPANGIAWVQGLSIVHTPLPPGNHVLKLDEKIVVPELGVTEEFHNTLNITVVPGG